MALKRMLVVGTHHDTYTVDLMDWRSGWKCYGAPVMTGPASGRTGNNDLPDFTEDSPGVALVEEVDGAPLVVGFLHGRISAMRFDNGRMVWRHESDAYFTVDRSANFEFAHPSGTTICISEAAGHVNLSGQDHDKQWGISKNTARAPHFHVAIANAGTPVATLHVDPAGNVSLVHAGNLTIDTGGNLSATVAGNLTADIGGTTSVTSTGDATVTAPNVVLDSELTHCTGALHVDGPIVGTAGISITGSYGGGPSAYISGQIHFNGVIITADGGSTMTFNGKRVDDTLRVTGVQSGSSTSGTVA